LLVIMLAAPFLGGRSAADPVPDPAVSQADLEKFEALAARFGVRSEDWFVAYFYRPRDVVFDATDKGRQEDYVKPEESHVEAFRRFLDEVDSDRDGRYTLRDDGFDPEYDAESMKRFDRNKDGVLTENDIAPRPNRSLQGYIRRIIESLPDDRQRYVGWPPKRRKPERAIEQRIIGLQEKLEPSDHVSPEAAERHIQAIKTAIAERASLLAPRLERGQVLFEQRCAGCHGNDGRGNGAAAKFVGDNLGGEGKLAPPRDIAWGVFKFQSRDVGKLPTDEDLFATVRRGLPGAAMPAWTELGDQQVWDLVDYVKHLAERARTLRFDDAIVPLFLLNRRIPPVDSVPDEPSTTPNLIREGRYSFMLMQCYTCHGISGGGDGPRAVQADSNGRLIQARNYQATRLLKGGSSLSEIYRTIAHGIGSTPMPAHTDDALVLTNDMPAEFTEAIKIGGDDAEEEEFFEEGEDERNELEEPRYEFRLVPGLAQAEVDQIKAYVSGLPTRGDVEMMSNTEHIRRARRCRWALAYYVRSLMPLDEHNRPTEGPVPGTAGSKSDTNNSKGTAK
jgi:mono/diheme cytochrome c family protein